MLGPSKETLKGLSGMHLSTPDQEPVRHVIGCYVGQLFYINLVSVYTYVSWGNYVSVYMAVANDIHHGSCEQQSILWRVGHIQSGHRILLGTILLAPLQPDVLTVAHVGSSQSVCPVCDLFLSARATGLNLQCKKQSEFQHLGTTQSLYFGAYNVVSKKGCYHRAYSVDMSGSSFQGEPPFNRDLHQLPD